MTCPISRVSGETLLAEVTLLLKTDHDCLLQKEKHPKETKLKFKIKCQKAQVEPVGKQNS